MEHLENRELSWLKFNKRVLEETTDSENPLLERLSFSAIYQSNLDEFFMVRVGKLTEAEKSKGKKKDGKSGMTAAQQLDSIFTEVRRLQPKAENAYRKMFDDLKPYGYEHVDFDTVTKEELTFLELYFKREIKPFITGIAVNDALPFPFLKNKEIYAVVRLGSKKGVNLGLVPVRHDRNERMIVLGNGGRRFILEEEVVLHFVHLLFKGCKVLDRALIRLTRSADIAASGTGSDFRDRMEELIIKRKKLEPVRLEVFDQFSSDALDYICKKLKIDNSRVFHSLIPLDLSYLFDLQELCDDPKLHFVPRQPRKSPLIADNKPVFAQVKAKDILLSYPFESMNLTFIRFLQECSADPKVTSIKITLYRLARSSKVIDALCTAAENGKDVLVMVELRARFDEENNIEWSKRLQKAGVRVIYGLKDYKVHSKLLLVTRKAQGGGSDHVTQVGTGNYNEKTSTLYTDLMLLTADEDIAADAANVFDSLENGNFIEQTKKLLVAPHCLRNHILEMTDEQIEIAKNGGEGYIAAKINSFSDSVIIRKFVEASQAGVKIDLVVRGLCCLIAGVDGYTENISVRSIVGRFLEHSRIFIFGKDSPEQKIYIGSADYMSRNTVRRVEVAAPVEDERLKKRIRAMFSVMMKDNIKARIMMPDGSYVHVNRHDDDEKINSQEYFYAEAYERLEKKSARKGQTRKRTSAGKSTGEKKTASRKTSASSAKSAAKRTAAASSTAKKTGTSTRGRKKSVKDDK